MLLKNLWPCFTAPIELFVTAGRKCRIKNVMTFYGHDCRDKMDNSTQSRYISRQIDMLRPHMTPGMTFPSLSTGWLLTVILSPIIALALGCRSTQPAGSAGASTSPREEWIAWQTKRHESIAGTNGWTTLVSRYWLPEGTTSVGADPTQQLVLPAGHAPSLVGVFTRTGKSVHFQAAPGAVVTVDGQAVSEQEMITDADENPTKLVIGKLTTVIIERGDRLGVRIRDPESPARLHFAGLQCFPYNPAWRLKGRFEAFPSVRKMRVPEASGGIEELVSPGAVVFHHEGVEYRLDVVEERGEKDYFVIFTDHSAGHSTYAAGRFLYVARPDAAGHVTIDFNRSYTPPCGFTPFATCPRPPQQNWLPFDIEAGERAPVEPN